MEWYEIVILIIIIIPVSAFIAGKIYEFRKNSYYNGSWRNRRKK